MSSRFGLSRKPKERVIEGTAELIEVKGPQSFPELLSDSHSQGLPTCLVEVEHYTLTNFGARHENEDRWMNYSDSCSAEASNMAFHTVGVLDGHDTKSASDLVSRLLPATVAKRLKDGQRIAESYEASMAEMEEALKKVHATAGTCVNSCLIAGRYIWCANLGDCRSAIMPLQEQASAALPPKVSGVYWMSQDHKASSPDEMKRIKKAGGIVVDGRVEGLEPSRTLGDFDVKTHTKPGVISIIPEIRCFELGNGRTLEQAILINCTDGVWDVMTAQDISDLIQARKDLVTLMAISASRGEVNPGQRRPLRDLAEDIVQFAVAKGSRDDCTAVVSLITVLPSVPS